MKYIAVVASTYGEGEYSACDYSTTVQATGRCAAASGTAQGSSGLADTGLNVLVVATIACFAVFASLFVRFWRRKQAAFQNIEVLENHRQIEHH